MQNYIEAKNIAFQGDLGFLKLPDGSQIPDGFEQVKPETKGFVLAYGEVSGHAHAIRAETAQIFFNPKSEKSETGWDEMYILCHKPTIIYHEEHTPVMLGVGLWKKWQQKEYNFENEYRVVAD